MIPNTKLAWLLPAALICILTACNPAPKYVKPTAPLAPSFKEAVPASYKENQGWKIAAPGDDKIRGKWWEVYNDPILNALEEQVAVSNQSIRAAEANYRSARAVVVSARAALFPTLTGNASYTNSRFSQTSRTAAVIPGGSGTTTTTTTTTTGSNGTNGSTGSTTNTGTSTSGNTGPTTTTGTSGGTSTGVAGFSSGIVNTYSLPLDVSYTVDLWHKVRNTIAEDAYQAQASAADVATALLSTQAELAQDYFEVRALDAEREILRNTVENYRRNVQLTQTLFNTGIDSEEDVAQAQMQLDAATAQATDLGVSRAQYEHAIAMLIGKPPAEFSLPVGEFVPKPPDVPVALPAQLLERRPDIAAAERQVAAANAGIGVARAAYFPNITLSASGGFETSQFLQWFTWPSRFWSVGPQLSEVLFDAGARRGLNEQAQASYDAAVANYRQTVLTVFQSVEDNLAALRILADEVVQEHTAVNSSSRYLDLSLTRYKAGMDSYLNVITAQNSVLSNRQTEVQIQLRQMTASVSLILALGGGWDVSQLPRIETLSKKTGKWVWNGQPLPGEPTTVAAPNPPPLKPEQGVPGAPNANPSTPQPTPPAAGSHPPASSQ